MRRLAISAFGLAAFLVPSIAHADMLTLPALSEAALGGASGIGASPAILPAVIPVPEPSSALLLLTGWVAINGFRAGARRFNSWRSN